MARGVVPETANDDEESLVPRDARADVAVAAPTPVPKRVLALLEMAERALTSDSLYEARVTYQTLLRIDPNNAMGLRGLSEVDRELATMCRQRGLRPDRRVRLAVSVEELLKGSNAPNDAAVLSHLVSREELSIEALLEQCTLPETAVLEILARFIDRDVVAVVES
jgi:hypothetical protein